MMSDQFWLAIDDFGELLTKHFRDFSMVFNACASKKGLIRGFLNERVLEGVAGLRGDASLI